MSEVSSHNSNPDDRADRLTDENLKHMGTQMLPPAEADGGALERWKRGASDTIASASGAAPTHSAPGQGARPMHSPRIMKLFGAGSAVAAALGICTFFFWQSAGTQVEASTIFTSLGNAMTQAFKMTFNNLKADGIMASGSVIASFPEDETAGDMPLVQINLHVTGLEDSEEYNGLDLILHGELLPESKWLYVKTAGLPEEVLVEIPFMTGFQQMAANGLILDLNNLPSFDGDAGADDADDEEDNSVVIMMGDDDAQDDGRSISFGLSLGASADTEESVDEEDGAADGIVVKSEQTIVIHNDADADDAGELIEDIFTREASPDQIAEFVELLQNAANDTTVEAQGGGRHLLTAFDFDFEELEIEDDEDVEWLAQLVLQVSYHEAEGVEWAMIDNVGEDGGNIRLDLVNVTIDEDATSMQSYVDDGVQVWDIGSLVAVFGALAD